MFSDKEYQGLTKQELEERLKALRQQRKTRYTMPKKGISTKEPVVASLKGIDSAIAAKILEELLATLEADPKEVQA